EENAARLRDRLKGLTFDFVLSSPLQRAFRTCELAGFGSRAETDSDLVEWDYGSYEGKTTAEIRRERPGWELFRDGCPHGETLADVSARADRVIARLRSRGRTSLVFSSGHILRVLTTRWCGLEPSLGQFLILDTATLSILGYNHTLDEPIIRLWNSA
ncbi:MAG: histidine phosphatase family protein, partial [Planctomycetia bacterium]|nr:histidine phosphatase family protein [Planctomycetia bacterium]